MQRSLDSHTAMVTGLLVGMIAKKVDEYEVVKLVGDNISVWLNNASFGLGWSPMSIDPEFIG